MSKPRIFISHSDTNFPPTDYAIRIIDLIGCIPVIAEREPKISRTVQTLVFDSMDTCDAVVVIATPDRDGPNGKEPSQGVLVEIGQLQISDKFRGKYFIIKEKSVVLGPMIPEARYQFENGNYSPIAEAILIELNSMGLFSNYYALPGSDMELHTLMETLSQLRDLIKKGLINKDQTKEIAEKMVRDDIIERLFKEVG